MICCGVELVYYFGWKVVGEYLKWVFELYVYEFLVFGGGVFVGVDFVYLVIGVCYFGVGGDGFW